MIAIAELRGTHIKNNNVIACDRCIEFLCKVIHNTNMSTETKMGKELQGRRRL